VAGVGNTTSALVQGIACYPTTGSTALRSGADGCPAEAATLPKSPPATAV